MDNIKAFNHKAHFLVNQGFILKRNYVNVYLVGLTVIPLVKDGRSITLIWQIRGNRKLNQLHLTRINLMCKPNLSCTAKKLHRNTQNIFTQFPGGACLQKIPS